jgi:glycosyltransferase involved in cell wall biosynthesis
VLQLVRSLDLDRYELDVVCPRRSSLWRDLEDEDRIALHELVPARHPSLGDALTLVTLMRLTRSADVIHAHSSKAGLLVRLAALARRRTGACVFTPHAWSFWAARGFRARLYQAFERLAARWCTAILVVSEHERVAGLSARIGTADQYRVIPNGVDPEEFSAEPEPVPGRILVVGRLARQKRPDIAIRAFAQVRERNPSAELHLVGDGPLRFELTALIAELGVADSVKFLGLRDDVPALLSRASCLVLSSDYEGCPYSVLEAMAAGVPVVATKVGGVPELVDERNGLLVEPGQPDELAEAVSALVADPRRARALGRAGRERVRSEFSLQRMTDAVKAVYREVASAGGVA